jgi:eukaryotic-like serine/threonine-protein kinase
MPPRAGKRNNVRGYTRPRPTGGIVEFVRHHRDIVIKVFHPALAAALGGDRFLAEIKTTARLQHPHILPLLDSGEAHGVLFYVMPFIAGGSLRARLDREPSGP